MRTIQKMTDILLSHKNGTRWSWGEFQTKIVGEKVPGRGTKAEIIWKRYRCQPVYLICDEMTKRGTCRQLIVECAVGVALIPKEEIRIVITKARIKKEVSTTRRTIMKYQNIVDSTDASKEDKAAAQKQISQNLRLLDRKVRKELTEKKVRK